MMKLALLSLNLLHYYPSPLHAFQAQSNRKLHPSSIYARNNDNFEPTPPSSLPKTQSQQARSSELKRRLARNQEGFATPGISSAIPGAQNYGVDASATERQYFANLGIDDVSFHRAIAAATAGEKYGYASVEGMDEIEREKQVALHTTLGMTHLRSLRLRAAYESFEYVYLLNPEAYLWQFGLLQYYFGEYAEGQKTCEENARRYELKFGGLGEVASEERIWRDACVLRLRGKRRRREDEENWDDESERREEESIAGERRKVIRLARQLFSSTVHNNPTNLALSRASLQSISQEDDTPTSILQKKLVDPKMYKLHSYFYLGLHYDALNQPNESKRCMKMALKTCANSIGGNNQDITYLLPVIHMTVRDWYDDDDDFEDVEDEKLKNEQELIEELMMDGAVKLLIHGTASNNNHATEAKEDKLTQSIQESIKHMRIVDLREELKKRKLKVGGSKKVLQDRLANAIQIDAKSKE